MMKLTQRNYHSRAANLEYMSVSQFKSFSTCQACAMAELKGEYKRPQTTALLVGSFVDAYFEGTLESFIKANPEIYTRGGTLRAEFIQAETIIRRIQRDKLFMQALSGKKQVIMTGEICGVPVKIKIDSLCPDKIVDLKIVKDFEPIRDSERGILSWAEYWDYYLQGAIYQEIVYQNTGKKLPFYLAAATKEKTTDIDIIEVEQDDLDFYLSKFKANVEYYNAIKLGVLEPERCERCNFCKETKVLTTPTSSRELCII